MRRNIILVPGLGGSVLFNKNNKKIWPLTYNTLFEKSNLLNNFDNTTLVTKIGDSSGILNKDWFTKYILKDTFYDKYTSIINPSCFPYDFRLLMNISYLNNLYNNYTRYIDELDKPVIIFCHSLGDLLFHDFLQTKEKFQK